MKTVVKIVIASKYFKKKKVITKPVTNNNKCFNCYQTSHQDYNCLFLDRQVKITITILAFYRQNKNRKSNNS